MFIYALERTQRTCKKDEMGKGNCVWNIREKEW